MRNSRFKNRGTYDRDSSPVSNRLLFLCVSAQFSEVKLLFSGPTLPALRALTFSMAEGPAAGASMARNLWVSAEF